MKFFEFRDPPPNRLKHCSDGQECHLTEGAVMVAFALPWLAMAPTAARADFQVTVSSRPAVGLVLLDKLMSGRSQVDDIVHYEVLANVRDDDGRVLIPAGSLAIGHVTRSKGSGMFGKRGQLEFTCEYVVLPGGAHVPLTGNKLGGPGANGTGATVAVTLLVSPLGLLIKGGTAKVDKGTPVVMYVADGATIAPTQNAPDGLVADFAFRVKLKGSTQ